MKNTLLAVFIIILSFIAITLYKSVDSLSKPFDKPSQKEEVTNTKDVKNDFFTCELEQRNTDFCIEIFQPVCAEIDVQCVTAPCPKIVETFSNSCTACRNSLVSRYTEGACISE